VSAVIVVCCKVNVSASDRSLVQRSPTECGTSLCAIYKPRELGGRGRLVVVAPETDKLYAKALHCRIIYNYYRGIL
jgi:hypothetical protein